MNEHPFLDFARIRAKALEIGWDDIGITSAILPEEDLKAYSNWLERGDQAALAYMENPVRADLDTFFPGAKTALLFITYYKQKHYAFQQGAGLIASYARGKDYHHLHRKRLKQMIQWLETETGLKNIAKGFSDSSPVLEKALAVKAGLGWFGKNTLLIHRRFGTFILLSGLLTTLEIPFDPPRMEMRIPRCGSCTRCLDACPTNAFRAPYQMNASLCLSYHLIESKKEIPLEISKKNPGYVFGCDICQDVCPHNLRKPLSLLENFQEEKGVGAYIDVEKIMDLERFPEKLFGTPLQRRGVSGLKYTMKLLDS